MAENRQVNSNSPSATEEVAARSARPFGGPSKARNCRETTEIIRISLRELRVADLRGKSSSHFDILLSTLEEWEAIIQSLEEFPVDHRPTDLPELENE